MSRTMTICFFLFISPSLFSQREYGIEYQRGFGRSYRSNSIGASFENFNFRSDSWYIVAQYTWDIFKTTKKTQGVSDFGLSVGFRYASSYWAHGNSLAGIRLTLSHITEKNHTKLTPSLELGYHHTFNQTMERGGFTTPSISVGYDIPIGKERAEDFHGFLFIPRIALGYRF